MSYRILVLKPPYGCALVTQVDGSIQLHYNTTHVSDETVFAWIKEVFDKHTDHVEQNKVAEVKALVPPPAPITVAGIIAPVSKVQSPQIENIPHSYSQPKPLNPPGQDHTFVGPYRIGKQCVVCGVKADGKEGKCPGTFAPPAPEEKT